MNALSSLKEFASSVARTKGSARATLSRDPRAKGSATESVDEQIALLVETLEAEARERHVPERSAVVEGRSAGTVARRSRHRIRSSSSTGAGVVRPFRERHQQILLYPSVVLLGAAVGLLVAVVFGR